MSFCPSCGSSISATAKFCGNCGKPSIGQNLSGQNSNSQSAHSINQGPSVGISGNVSGAIAQTIFIAPVSMLNVVDKILSSNGATPFAILSGSSPADIRLKIKNKLTQINKFNQMLFSCI